MVIVPATNPEVSIPELPDILICKSSAYPSASILVLPLPLTVKEFLSIFLGNTQGLTFF